MHWKWRIFLKLSSKFLNLNFQERIYRENNIRFKYIIYYKYCTRLISVKKKKKKKNYLIFLAIFIIGYIIFHEQKRVCVCATRANNIVLRWYSTRDVLLRNKRREFKSMFKRSYGKKEGTSIARSTPRRSEVSLKDSCSLGAGRSWKRENKKKRERKREDFSTARKSASLLAFLPSPSYACSFTLANSLTLTLFSFFFPSPPLVSFRSFPSRRRWN